MGKGEGEGEGRQGKGYMVAEFLMLARAIGVGITWLAGST